MMWEEIFRGPDAGSSSSESSKRKKKNLVLIEGKLNETQGKTNLGAKGVCYHQSYGNKRRELGLSKERSRARIQKGHHSELE